jgi:hypothetical protein
MLGSQSARKGPAYAVYDPWDGGRRTLAAKDRGTDDGRNIGHADAYVILLTAVAGERIDL